MSNNFGVSVVVCTYSCERYLDTIETVKSLLNQSYDNLEIILIVDRNVDLYNQIVSNPCFASLSRLKIGISKLPGLSNARNKGVELAFGEIIAFIDDDAVADPCWISNLIKYYNDPAVIGVGGPMRPLWITGEAKWIPEEFYWAMGCSYKSQKNSLHYVRSNFGSNMSFRKTVFEKVGYFDDSFGLIDDKMRTGEETEFSVRALNKVRGSKIIYNPEAIVFHKIYRFRKSLSFIIERCYNYGYAISKLEKSKSKVDTELESTEKKFLKYLFMVSFIERLSKIICFKNIYVNTIGFLSLIFFTLAVGVGFLFGKTRSFTSK